jgi:capsular exopolysaccharide synthesis family protein
MSRLREVPGILRRHLWLIAAIATAVVGVATWLASRETAEYRSSATIRLLDPQPGMLALTDSAVLGKVVDLEGLRIFSTSTLAPAGFVVDAQVSLPPERSGTIHLEFSDNRIAYGPSDERRMAAYGDPIPLNGASFIIPSRPRDKVAMLSVVPRATAIEYLVANLRTILNRSTGGVEVQFTSTELRIVSRTVNMVVEVYEEVSAESAREGVRRRRASLEEQLRATDSLLLVAQTEIGILRTREQQSQLEVELQADLRLYENILNVVLQARNSGRSGDLLSPRSLPGVASDPIVGPLYTRLFNYRVEREAMLAGPSARTLEHPDVQRLSTLIASTEENLVEAIGTRIGLLRGQIGVMSSMVDSSRTEAREVDLTRNVEAMRQTAAQLRNQYQETRLEEATEAGPAEIVELSTRAVPLRTNVWIRLFLALVLGLVIGGAAAVAREMFDGWRSSRAMSRVIEESEAIETSEAIEKGELVQNLAVIPEVTPSLVEPGANGDFRPGPLQSAGLEAYRLLRSRLLSAKWGLKTLVVTSAHPGEGKTTTSTNLAATYARQGLKVVIVECDFRRPSLGRYFGNKKEADLMDVLFENHDWRHAIQLTKMPGLYVLLGEKSFPRSGDSLGGPEMKRLLAELSHEYDMVILDTSPLLVAADAIALGPIVDGVLIVVRATRTDRRTLEEVVERLSLAGASIVGTVLNDPEGATSR